MGWKLSAIFINTNKQIDEIELFQNLGFENVKPIASKAFEEILNPVEGELYIGSYKGTTILCIPALPYSFLEEGLKQEEVVLVNAFPDTEISGLMLHSVVNFYGYTLIKNGEKIRVKGGSADDGVVVDFGPPLQEEIAILKKSKLNADGDRIYRLDDYPDEDFTEDQLGENFVFELSERYIGETLDSAEDLLFETTFRGYSYTDTEAQIKETKKIKKRTQWLKYVIYIVLFFIIRFIVKYIFDL
ncbi:DUF6928 family protein [Lacinutrix chionoecetis]